MKATKTLTGLALLTSLAACGGGGGGGGGGVSISPPTQINFGSIANATVDMSFISQYYSICKCSLKWPLAQTLESYNHSD